MFTIGQRIKDKTTGKIYTVKRINKNNTVRVTFWDRYERLIECTARSEEFEPA